MSDVRLSYVVTTFNKFPYLQEVVSHLIANKKEDEEIIITDGKSTDGTVDWLKQLHSAGKIDVFISEKDLGEAHGFNKAMMLAKGELIKIITADDIFYYPAIAECKEFMLNHPEIDIVTSVIPTVDLREKGSIRPDYEAIPGFEKWLNKETSFFYFNCIPVMIRRSQLPKLGLLHTAFTMVDYEYSMRVSKTSSIALYTNPMALRILNEISNLLTMGDKKRSAEYLKVNFMYDKVKLKSITDYSYMELAGAALTKTRHLIAFRTRMRSLLGTNKPSEEVFSLDIPSSIPEAFALLHKWIEDENKKQKGRFIFS